ncbi:MFS transporter [Elusimicrobiota bacterium]
MYKKLLSENKDFAKIYFAGIISTLGDILFDIFLMWQVYVKTGRVTDVGLILGINYLARGLVSLISGHLVDIFPRKRIMIIGDVVRGLLVLAFVLALDHIDSRFVILACVFTIEVFTTLFDSAKTAAIPDLVGKKNVVVAGSLAAVSRRVMTVLGALVSGIIVEHVAPVSVLLINSSSFFISAFLVNLSASACFAKPSAQKIAKVSEIGSQYLSTVRIILKDRFIVAFMLLLMLLNFPYSLIQLVPLVGAKVQVIGGASWIGMFRGAIAIGEILGLFLIGSAALSKRISLCFKIGLIGPALGYLLIYNIHIAGLVIAGLFIYGLTDALSQPLFSYFTAHVPSDIRGKVLGIFDCCVLLIVPLALYAASKAMDSYGAGVVCLASSCALLIAALIFILRPEFRITASKDDS